jgi:hypothetical protein
MTKGHNPYSFKTDGYHTYSTQYHIIAVITENYLPYRTNGKEMF